MPGNIDFSFIQFQYLGIVNFKLNIFDKNVSAEYGIPSIFNSDQFICYKVIIHTVRIISCLSKEIAIVCLLQL